MQQDELRRLEDQCIQEHAPACTAACPLHVDVRAIAGALQQGDFAAALKALRKAVPFPGLIGRVCDQPCQAVCKRREASAAIAIAALERACADWGGPAEKPRVLPKRGKRVAIVGGGLSGLTAAYDLARKGYTVVVYEAGDQLGGDLWRFSDQVLPRDLLRAELDQVAALGVEVRLQARIAPEALAELRRDADALYLAPGNRPGALDLERDAQGQISVDPVTYATPQAGVFAGGSRLRGAEARSPIRSMGDGRRAAISIDRYLQNVSLTAARINEAPYTTRLYTNTRGLPPLPQVPAARPAEGYTPDEARPEAQRCLRCECLECVKICEYLKQYGSYPKRYVREIYNNLSIVQGTRQKNQFINSCSLCGLCKEVCPTDLNMAEPCLAARQSMVAVQRMPPSAHDFALRDLAFSNSPLFALARHQPGATASRYLFFPGCQLSGSAPEQVTALYTYLTTALVGGVGLALRCCGAPAEWAGRTDLFQAALADFQEAHAALGAPELIVACSSCYRVFQAHAPDVPLTSLWTLLDRLGLPAAAGPAPAEAAVALHDPCATRHAADIQDSVRHLLAQRGYRVEELPLTRATTECCGYGGLMWLANPPLARAVVRRRAAESPLPYVTYCAMCRDQFAAQGKPTLHLLDLVLDPATAAARAQRPNPDYSQRHENRARLKQNLLDRLWGEKMEEAQRSEPIRLLISDAVRATLAERLILEEDLRQVIAQAERLGRRLRHRATGHYLAYYRPHTVTYWVEYTPEGEAFVIHNAYSHRMVIEEAAQP